MMILLRNISISGYRSFAQETQFFDKFEKVNLIIGQNNSGKSNVLRLISDVCKKGFSGRELLTSLDRHLPRCGPPHIGVGEEFCNGHFRDNSAISNLIEQNTRSRQNLKSYFERVCSKKKALEDTELVWTYYNLLSGKPELSSWESAISQSIGRGETKAMWELLTSSSGGDYESTWLPFCVSKCLASFPHYNSVLIPAVRKMGARGSVSEDFDGDGLIERLVKLQNPNAEHQSDRERFRAIVRFLRTVTGNADAELEIPHSRETIVVHMNGRSLPIESLGSGIQEVIILAAAATVLDNFVICIEEPEIHLNPVLQRKLLRYLSCYTKNQYFISTHSAALMDSPGVEIYHVVLKDGASTVSRVTSDGHRSAVCEDLGYHPSDLLQANCVIWVEGPSDRIYIKHWIESKDKELIEGVHYVIMFYGGRLAAHISNADNVVAVDGFISLRRLNRRGVIVIDSDRSSPKEALNSTKTRLVEEFNSGPGFAWVTAGREIENYIPFHQISSAISATHPSYTVSAKGRRYENYLSVCNRLGKKVCASKVEVSAKVTEINSADFSVFDLEDQVSRLVQFIRESNPHVVQSLVV